MASRGPDFATGRVLDLTDGAIELRDILDSAAARSQLVLVDFSATWCGPCRMLAPVLDALAAEHAGRVVVVKVDCERTVANQALAASASVSAYPTLKFYVDNRDVETLRGANPGALRASLARHLAALGPPPPAGGPNLAAALAAALGRVKAGCGPAEFMTAAKTLAGIVTKIVEHPQDPKYRTIKLSNASYRAKLGSRVGGRECMEVLGFKERTEAMEAVLVMDRVPENLGTVVSFLNAAIAAAEGSSSGGGSGSASTPTPRSSAPPPPAAAPMTSTTDAEAASAGQIGMEDLLFASQEERLLSDAAHAQEMADACQAIIRMSATLTPEATGPGSAPPALPDDLPVVSDLPGPTLGSGAPHPPPLGLPAASRVPNRLRAAAPDLSRRVWIYGAWIVPLAMGAGILAAVPPAAPQRWLHFTPRTMAKALARCMQQAGLG